MTGELAELTRVVKPGGWLIDCPGEEPQRMPDQELIRRGWEILPYQAHWAGRYTVLVNLSSDK